MKTVFITRSLSSGSVFQTKLEAAGFVVKGISLLKFSAISFNKIPPSDWIFFYSKNGVKFFFKGMEEANLNVAEHMRWGAMGKGTAEVLAKKVTQIDFIGQGNILQTATDFLARANGQIILFPQATNSRQTIQRILEDNIIQKDLIVYRNEPKKRLNIPDADILVFTSPMNVKAYFKDKVLFDDQKVFAIGRTTAKALVSIGIEEFNIAAEPSEEALVEVILNN